MEEGVASVLKIAICAASLVVALTPNVLYAAFALLVAFMGVAGVYVFGGADLLAGAQVIVYVGGILVVILFAIMLSHRIYNIPLTQQIRRAILPAIIGGTVVTVLHNVRTTFHWDDIIKKPLPPIESSVATIGNALLKEFIFPFEAISILLLVALVGGMVMSRPVEREIGEPFDRNSGRKS